MAKLRAMLDGLWRAGRSAARSYLVIVRGRSEGAGLARLTDISRGGPLNWLGLAVLAVSVLSSAYLSFQGHEFPLVTAGVWEGEHLAVPLPALYVCLLVISFAWAYILAGAAAHGLGAYVLVAAYAAYYGLYAGLGLGGTVWFALAPIWLLILGGWVASSTRGHWRLPLLLLLSLMAAWLSHSSLGLGRVLPGTWSRLVLAGCYFSLVANPWALKPRPFHPRIAFALSLTVYALLYALNLWRIPPDQVFENAFLSVHGLLGLVGLYWYWLGLDLLNGAQDLAEWLVSTLKTLLPRRALRILVFAVWAVWVAAAYRLAHELPPGLTRRLLSSGWGERLVAALGSLRPSLALVSALECDLYLTVGIVALATVLAVLRRLSEERLLGLLGLSVAGFLMLWSYFGLFLAFGDRDPGGSFGFWPLLLFSGGMFWEILKTSPALPSRARSRSLLFLGFLLLLGGISLLALSAGYALFEQELSLNSFFGLLYLGLPYLLYTALYRKQGYTLISPRHLILLFALGMLTAIPCLALGKLFLAPALWLLAVWGVVWRRGQWDDPWDGPIYALAAALGFVVFYTHPIYIPIPAFAKWLADLAQLQAGYGDLVIWPWQAAWRWILLGSVASSLALGAMLGRARSSGERGRAVFLVLAALVGMAVLGGVELLRLGGM